MLLSKEYTNSQVKNLIDEYIHSERDRALLKRRYIDGICYLQIAEEFGLSVKQVQNIINKHTDVIFSKMYTPV